MITIASWPGLATNASQYSIPPGAATEQINIQSLVPGKINVRNGMTAIAASASDRVIRMFLFQDGLTSRLMLQDAQGRITST